MTRVTAVLLSASLLISSIGCNSARSRAEWRRDLIQEGMTKAEVTVQLGPPWESFPVPGQPNDPRLPVENWRYRYSISGWTVVLIIITLGLSAPFMNCHRHYFDLGFNADGRVNRISAVFQVRDPE